MKKNKQVSKIKRLYPFVLDTERSDAKCIYFDKDQALEYIREVFDSMDDRAQEKPITIGFVGMTDRQMENLKDIEEL